MDFELLKTFLTITERETISGAASQLYTSQSTISHRLQTLEDELHIKIFERQRGIKKMALTPQGERFYELAMQWQDLEKKMHQLHLEPMRTKVKIGSLDSINQHLLYPVFMKILGASPSLQLEFYSLRSQEIYRKINTNELDVGFAFLPVYYNNIVAEPIFKEQIYMVSSPDSIYPPGVVDVTALEKSKEVFVPWDADLTRWHNEWWDTYIPPFVKVDSISLLCNCLVHPDNWAMCPASVAFGLNSEGLVKIHSFSVAPPNRICYMLHRKPCKSFYDNHVSEFIDAFRCQLEHHPWHYTQ